MHGGWGGCSLFENNILSTSTMHAWADAELWFDGCAVCVWRQCARKHSSMNTIVILVTLIVDKDALCLETASWVPSPMLSRHVTFRWRDWAQTEWRENLRDLKPPSLEEGMVSLCLAFTTIWRRGLQSGDLLSWVPIGGAVQPDGGHVQCGVALLNGDAAHCQHLGRHLDGVDVELERHVSLNDREHYSELSLAAVVTKSRSLG